MTWKNLELMGR